VAAIASLIVHAAGSAARGDLSASRPDTQTASTGAGTGLLPVLSPPVQALTGDPYPAVVANAPPQPAGSAAASAGTNGPAGTSIASVLPVLPLPAPNAATTAGRLSRADALPAPAVSAGASRGSTSGAGAAAQLDSSGGPPTQYTAHTIEAGETMSSIAASYGVSVASVMANNPSLDDFDLIQPGQTLRIPSTTGILYNVQPGDTLSGISQRYGVAASEVLNLPANALQNADDIKAGATILLPGNIQPPPPPAPVVRPLLVPASPPIVRSSGGGASASAAPAPTAAVAHFIWPVQGPITQGFGVPELGVGAPHTGIDIGLYGRDGTPIAAAAGGTVIFSGGDACCGYGYYVIVQHSGGFTTLYGHLSRRGVSVGDSVNQGETVGYAGSTGFSTGTHLHFEMHLNGQLVNPLNYLP